MRALTQRFTALLLALLLLCSAGSGLSYAALEAPADPACVLGADPKDMLAGGGRTLHTELGVFYVGDDGGVYLLNGPAEPVLEGPARALNYADGVLYFAREGKEGCFDLCAFELESAEETVLLANFSGKLGQLYLVDGEALEFSCGDAIWRLELETGDYRLIRFIRDLWSFVPTGCGPICATGCLFRYTLYAGDQMIVERADDYYVDYDAEQPRLVYTVDQTDYQVELAALFSGEAEAVPFTGLDGEYVPVSAETVTPAQRARNEELEVERIRRELSDILTLPENLPEAETEEPCTEPDEEPTEVPTEPTEFDEEPTEVPTEPTEPDEEPTEAPTESTEPDEEPTEAPTEPAEVPTEPAEPPIEEPSEPDAEPSEPTPVQPASWGDVIVVEPESLEPAAIYSDHLLRRSLSAGQTNIVRRARQMLSVRWTPVKDIAGWGYYSSGYSLKGKILYKAGHTYVGLPYSQNCSYVPWYTSLSGFVEAVNNPNSKMYTKRISYGRGGPYYGTDCSGFTSYSWDTGKINHNIMGSSIAVRVGNSYTQLQVGDAILSSWHAEVITDVTYNSDGSIASIEVAQANPTTAFNGCCYTTRYTGAKNLARWEKAVLHGGYSIYRKKNLADVGFTPDPAAPLEGEDGLAPWEPPTVKPGVDVSQWNGTVEWKTIAPHVGFAVVRVGGAKSQATFEIFNDDAYAVNAAGCKANKIPFGVYWYAGATTTAQARQEAQRVLQLIGTENKPDLPVFYDVEESKNILKLSDKNLRAVINAFCTEIEKGGLKAGVYASTGLWNNQLKSLDRKWVRWAARWESNQMGVVSDETTANGANLWQYTNVGRLPGVDADFDLSYWLGEVGNTEFLSGAGVVPPTCTDDGMLYVTNTVSLSGGSVELGETRGEKINARGHSILNGYCTVCKKQLEEHVCPCGDFVDLPAVNTVEHTAIEWAYSHEPYKVTAGMNATHFGTNLTVTRAQAMTFFWAAKDRPKFQKANDQFKDVKKTDWYYKSVMWAVENGITVGVDETHFAPNKTCNRGELLTFLYAAMGKPKVNIQNPYKDVKNQWYRKAALWAYENGLEKGEDGRFHASTPCTRVSVVTYLYRFETGEGLVE